MTDHDHGLVWGGVSMTPFLFFWVHYLFVSASTVLLPSLSLPPPVSFVLQFLSSSYAPLSACACTASNQVNLGS